MKSQLNRVEIDWFANPKRRHRLQHHGEGDPFTVVRLRSGRLDWFIGAEPNQLIWDFLKENPQPSAPPAPVGNSEGSEEDQHQ